MLIYRRPKPGRYGTHIVFVQKSGGTLTANTTTTFKAGGFKRTMVFLQFVAFVGVKPADADGAITAKVVIRAADGTTRRVVSADINLETLTNDVATAVGIKAGLADKSRVLLPGEAVEFDVVNDSAAIDTQPTDLVFTAEFALVD